MISKKISDQIAKTFMELVKIPSPSGLEKQVGAYIHKHLKKHGWTIFVDKSGELNNSNYGNLIARLEKRGTRRIIFVAHMDTVQQRKDLIKPKLSKGVFRSDGDTILGADNKASVAVLLTLAKQEFLKDLENDIVLAFTTREEDGQMGSKYLDIKRIKPDYIVNIDGSSPIGTIDKRSMGQLVFEINIYGKAAHAAEEPQKGIHVIKVGAQIVDSLKMGIISKGTTFNIGAIHGGQNTNIIPDKCFLKGEIRSFSEKEIKKQYEKLKKTVKNICAKFYADCGIKTIVYIPPFAGKNNKKFIQKVKKILNKLSLKFVGQDAFCTSDSSYLSQNNVPTITLCKGGGNPHSKEEHISLKEMEDLYLILEKLISDIK